MKKANQTKTEFKAIDVVLPTIKLRVQDIAALRGLLSDGPKCYLTGSQKARLKVLALIEDVEIPPCPKDVAKHKASVQEIVAKVSKAVAPVKWEDWDWDALDRISFYYVRNPPKPRTVTQVTAAGKKLLMKGTAQVTIQKGCR